MDDAGYDALKRRNAEIESRFPNLKRPDSPSEQVGAKPSDGFGKITHAVRMMSLSNGFDDADIHEFDASVRKYLGAPGEIAYTAEPKIDGLSLSLRYENGTLVHAATRGDGDGGVKTSLPMPAPLPPFPIISRAHPKCSKCAAKST